MAEQTATQKVLIEMVERYEAMFAHFAAIRQVVGKSENLSLLSEYFALVQDSAFSAEIRAKFAPLKYGISVASQDSDIFTLIRRIPLATKVGKP